MLGLTPEAIYKYGSYVFIFWIATFLVRKMWSLFEGRLKNIDDNTTENKKLNKDIAVIIAQTLTKLEKHDTMSEEAWNKVLTGFDRVCDFLNGKNPAIAKFKAEIRSEMKELKEKVK